MSKSNACKGGIDARRAQRLVGQALAAFALLTAGLMGSARAAPPYPTAKQTVLLHGLFGMGNTIMGGSYFNDLPGWIKDKTGKYPLIPDLGSGTLEQSYDIAKRTIDGYCAGKGYCKVHLVAHSRGGLVGRMLMERMPERIASLNMLGTPHRGSFAADMLKNEKVKEFVQYMTFHALDNWYTQISELTYDSMNNSFNKKFKLGMEEAAGQQNFCARSDRNSGTKSTMQTGLRTVDSTGTEHLIYVSSILSDRFGSTWDEFKAYWPNIVDPSYYMLHMLGALGANQKKYSSRNDGVVPICSGFFGFKNWTKEPGFRNGYVLDAVNHGDLVQQLVGMSTSRGFDASTGQMKWIYKNVP